MEKVKLAEFDIDIDSVVKSAAELRKLIDQIKQEQKENTRETQEQNKAYVQNDAALKALNKEYNEHIKVLTNNIKATADAANREALLEAALSQEVTTIAEAREQNKLLSKLRNEANLATAEGRDELKLLNNALDENNEFIKENVDALSQQKINVGNYTESIREAFSVSALLTGGVAGLTSALTAAGKGFVSMTKSALVFLATPIGAVIGAIGVVIGLVANAMNRSEESTNKISKAFSIFSGITNALLDALEPLGEFLIDGIVVALEKAAKAASDARNAFADFLDFVGWESAAEGVREYDKAINEAIKSAQNLAQAESNLEKAQRQARLVQLEYQKQAESFRQIRDDETKTIQERIKANEQLGLVLEAQLQQELMLAQAALMVANLRIEQEGETKEALDAQYEALTAIADIEERINGQRSEQLVNRISLQREASDLAIQQQKDELDLFLAQAGEKARTLQEELNLEQAASDRRREILKAELNAKKLTRDAYNAELIRIDEDLARRRAEIAVDTAMQEVEANRMALELQRENAQFLSAELAEIRKQENATILLQEQELARLRLEQGLINQTEFDTAIRELSEANRLANKAIDDERKAIEKQEAAELRAIEFEEELIRLQEEGATRFEIQQAQLAEQQALEQEKLEERRTEGAISEELYNARLNNIRNKYARASEQAQLANERALAQQRIDIANTMFSAIAGLVDKNSAFGKILAISQAVINTYQGITKALAETTDPTPTQSLRFANAAAVAITGFKAVKDIASTKVPKAEGGNLSTRGAGSVSQAGSEMQGLSSNQSNLTAVAASGNATVQQRIDEQANNSGLVDNVTAAVREGAAQGTAQGSEQGITNLTENKAIQKSSTF